MFQHSDKVQGYIITLLITHKCLRYNNKFCEKQFQMHLREQKKLVNISFYVDSTKLHIKKEKIFFFVNSWLIFLQKKRGYMSFM